MKNHPCNPRIALIVAALCVAPAIGANRVDRTRSYEGFTQPIREIEVSASEGGRLSIVSVRRGDVIEKGAMLMELDSEILEARREIAAMKARNSARINSLRVEVTITSDRYGKLKRLFEQGAGNPEEVKRAKANAEVAELAVKAAEEERVVAELELAEIDAMIEQRRVRSPISGIVTDVMKEEGEYVSLNDPHVATVVQLDQLRATFFVPTSLAVKLQLNGPIELMMPYEQLRAMGRIEHIGAVTKADSGRVRVDAIIDNTDNRYRSGVRCVFIARESGPTKSKPYPAAE